VADVIAGLEQLQAFFNLSEAGCNETINFAYSGSTAFGVSQYGNILFHASTLNFLHGPSPHILCVPVFVESFMAKVRCR
jgi:hypothetical protein